jgi:hypothetical protein
MNEEKGDARPDKFSYSDVTSPLVHQRSCHMTYTLNVHDILEKVLIVRQCLMVESKVLVQGIVRLLKIRLTVSLTKRGISFYRTRRMAYLRSIC